MVHDHAQQTYRLPQHPPEDALGHERMKIKGI
jgi:hypothetical protein